MAGGTGLFWDINCNRKYNGINKATSNCPVRCIVLTYRDKREMNPNEAKETKPAAIKVKRIVLAIDWRLADYRTFTARMGKDVRKIRSNSFFRSPLMPLVAPISTHGRQPNRRIGRPRIFFFKHVFPHYHYFIIIGLSIALEQSRLSFLWQGNRGNRG